MAISKVLAHQSASQPRGSAGQGQSTMKLEGMTETKAAFAWPEQNSSLAKQNTAATTSNDSVSADAKSPSSPASKKKKGSNGNVYANFHSTTGSTGKRPWGSSVHAHPVPTTGSYMRSTFSRSQQLGNQKTADSANIATTNTTSTVRPASAVSSNTSQSQSKSSGHGKYHLMQSRNGDDDSTGGDASSTNRSVDQYQDDFRDGRAGMSLYRPKSAYSTTTASSQGHISDDEPVRENNFGQTSTTVFSQDSLSPHPVKGDKGDGHSVSAISAATSNTHTTSHSNSQTTTSNNNNNNSTTINRVNDEWKLNYIPAERDAEAYRSRSAPPRRLVSSEFDLHIKPRMYVDDSPSNPVLLHRRYPAISDRQTTRWSTETKDSFRWSGK